MRVNQKLTIMSENYKQFRFWRKWTLLNAAFFIIAYILVAIFGILAMEAFSLPIDEWGTSFQQTIWKIGEGIIIGFSIGFIQWRLLRRIFNVSFFWVYSVTIGIIIVELAAGLVLWKLEIDRGECSFWENYPLLHALIAAIYGLTIGFIQFPLLKKHFTRSTCWILISTLAWGLSILITAIKVKDDVVLLVTFVLGVLLYGAITGAALMYVMKKKEP